MSDTSKEVLVADRLQAIHRNAIDEAYGQLVKQAVTDLACGLSGGVLSGEDVLATFEKDLGTALEARGLAVKVLGVPAKNSPKTYGGDL